MTEALVCFEDEVAQGEVVAEDVDAFACVLKGQKRIVPPICD